MAALSHSRKELALHSALDKGYLHRLNIDALSPANLGNTPDDAPLF